MFVIYHTGSTVRVGPTENGRPHSLYAKSYKTAHHAAKTCTKFNATGGIGPGPYGWCSYAHYVKNVVRKVERVNLMSGKTYIEESNTLSCCSPASETYWSM